MTTRFTAAFDRWYAASTKRSNAKANAKRHQTTHPEVSTPKARPAMIHVHVYRVGIFDTWRSGRLHVSRRYLAHQIKARNWRTVRNHFNEAGANEYCN